MKISFKGLLKVFVRFVRSKSKYRISFDIYSQRTDFDKFDNSMLLSQIGYYGHHVEKALKHHHRGERGTDKANRLRGLLKVYKNRKNSDPKISDWAINILHHFDNDYKLYVEKIKKDEELFPETLDFIRTRTTVRFWKNKKISKKIIEDILHSALTSSISCNRQSVKFVIENKKSETELGDSNNPSMLKKAPVTIYVIADGRFYSEKYANALDVGGVCATLLLSAKTYGISGCWIYAAETRNQKELRNKFGLKKHDYIYSHVTLGYPYDNQEKPPRSFKEKLFFHEKE